MSKAVPLAGILITATARSFLAAVCAGSMLSGCATTAEKNTGQSGGYEWTPDHMHVGVRWQPFGRPANDAYDAKRPVIAKDSSYVQFWVSWGSMEPERENTDYRNHMSDDLRTIDRAVDACVREGKKVEFVFFHCPSWASESGEEGAWKPRPGEFARFAKRIATHFKGRVQSYQLYHEGNLQSLITDGDIHFVLREILGKGGRAIRSVYRKSPAMPVLLSSGGTSPCDACDELKGLRGKGAEAMVDYYRRIIRSPSLMSLFDALNINVSDHFNGYGMMDGKLVSSTWDQYDLVRRKLDAAGYRSKKIRAAESWVVWDDSQYAPDANGDGRINEQDAYDKTLALMGQCLQRGMNTMNLPWSDNSSSWSMGLTKRRDYNGRVGRLAPGKVIPADDGGPGIVAARVRLEGDDNDFEVIEMPDSFTARDFANPGDPNHLHYYIWRWFAQIAGGSDEVVRHAMAGEEGNNITVWSPAFGGRESYKISSWNRTRGKFTVLVYASAATGKSWAKVAIPSTVQKGRQYNNRSSRKNFRGEGFPDGSSYRVRVTTKDISRRNGRDVNVRVKESGPFTVEDGELHADVEDMNKFTTIEFLPAD